MFRGGARRGGVRAVHMVVTPCTAQRVILEITDPYLAPRRPASRDRSPARCRPAPWIQTRSHAWPSGVGRRRESHHAGGCKRSTVTTARADHADITTLNPRVHLACWRQPASGAGRIDFLVSLLHQYAQAGQRIRVAVQVCPIGRGRIPSRHRRRRNHA
jgi:hypothetical protein